MLVSDLTLDKVTAAIGSLVVLCVLSYLAIAYRDATATTALIALATPGAVGVVAATLRRAPAAPPDAPASP